MIKKLIPLTIALLLIGHVLLFYPLTLKMFVLVFIAFTIFFLFIEWQKAITVGVSLAIATLIFGVFLKISGTNELIYYRPHEMFSHPDGRYEKNVRFEMTMPHGDLKALALYAEVTPQPRKVIFCTDSLGFRNSKEYHGQKYLLVGDSFIVGNGTTQQEIITEQLFNKYGIDTYNLAFQGNIEAYANYVQSLKKLEGTGARIILFLFEGNDFQCDKERTSVASTWNSLSRNPMVEAFRRYKTLFSKTDIYRFLYSSTRRIWAAKIKKEEEKVEVRNIGEIPVAFYKRYITVTEQDFLPENSEIEKYISSLKNDITHIFFIPTKYRVYYRHLNNHKQQTGRGLPNKQWELVELAVKKFDIPTTNLTPALIEESDKLLKEGTLTYWRDDTHWNKHGIAVAADIVKREIFSHN